MDQRKNRQTEHEGRPGRGSHGGKVPGVREGDVPVVDEAKTPNPTGGRSSRSRVLVAASRLGKSIVRAGAAIAMHVAAEASGPATPAEMDLLAAIWRSEGGVVTRYPYGIKSIPTSGNEEARLIALGMIRSEWKKWDGKRDFIEVLADRWCPRAADPIGHKNWIKNVSAIYRSLGAKRAADERPPGRPASRPGGRSNPRKRRHKPAKGFQLDPHEGPDSLYKAARGSRQG